MKFPCKKHHHVDETDRALRMILTPDFPTALHKDAAEVVTNYFSSLHDTDTVLMVNSCARGQAVAESDLDMAVLVKPSVSHRRLMNMQGAWETYAATQPVIVKYKASGPFAHLHLDVIDGNYKPLCIGNGEPVDNFEIEIGNQIRYAAPMGQAGTYFNELQERWLPYYQEELRLQRFINIGEACEYDLNHIPMLVKRGLHFHAFDTLCKAFQKYLMALFMANKTYPVAYNKWIKEQVAGWLAMPALYSKLSAILSVGNIESDELNDRAQELHKLLKDLTKE